MTDINETRNALPEASRELFDDIVLSRVLGASRQTRLIGQMMVAIAEDKAVSDEQAVERIMLIASYFKNTRGRNSRAIYNAISAMTCGLAALNKGDARAYICEKVKRFDDESKEQIKRVTEYAASVCSHMKAVMVFDYSSVVDGLLSAMPPETAVYIPESRALDGGKPFLKTAAASGREVRFIPDTTMLVAIKKCDAAFIGAETIYPDGSVFNTVGSDILALCCESERVPLYVMSPLIKTDSRPVYGYERLAPMPFDYSVRLAADWSEEEKAGINFEGVKLIKLEPRYVKAFITEEGIIPPFAIYETAMRYIAQFEKGNKLQ